MENRVRLQKLISAAGIASRRKAEILIKEGRVTLNGQVVRELGTKADASRDHIKVDGKLIRQAPMRIRLLLNKPRRVICSVADPQGRIKVTDLVKVKEKVYPVGRLDYNTEGLILLTNDGDFARIVSSAGEHIPKVYHVKVKSVLDDSALERLKAGIRLGDGTKLARSKIRPLRVGNNSWYEVTLTQGRNQQIRRMFGAVGHSVMKLRRVAIGFLTDRNLPVGTYRPLNEREVARLLKSGTKATRRLASC